MAQWETFGNSVVGGDYLGADATSIAPLHLRTIPDLPIHFSTSDTLRMRINPYLPNVDLGKEWPGQELSGFVGIGDFGTMVVNRPVSLLHLDHNGGALVGWRPWMRTGTLCTVGSDLMYVGTKQEAPDRVDAVIGWADNLENVSAFGPDALRFIFTRAPYLTGAAADTNGLEIARMIPDTTGNDGFLGLGDFFNAGTQPDERLDLLGRTIRIRQLVPDYQNDTLDMMVVTDSTGRLHWRPLNTLSGTDCAWTLQGTSGTNQHIATAYQGNPGCPQEDKGVGIGLVLPKYKLHVAHDYSEAPVFAGGIKSEFLTASSVGHGLSSEVRLPQGVTAVNQNNMIGLFSVAVDGRRTIGVEGLAIRSSSSTGNSTEMIGVRGIAQGENKALSSIGVYGSGAGAISGSGNWGGYFEGRGFLGAAAWTYSDEALKTEISNVDPAEALEIVKQLGAKRYNFNADEYAFLSLPTEGQIGLISQEVEALLPELVMDVQRPAVHDSTGVEVEPALTFKAMNYSALIPVLVAAIQEQQVQAEAIKEQVAALEQALAACCAPAHDGAFMQAPLDSEGKPKMDPAMERLLRIDPNPFTEATTVRYTLERAGRVQLLVNSGDGKRLQVLHEGLASAGDHSYDWNTGHLAPGMYYVTLLLDGEPLVKRAVKVR